MSWRRGGAVYQAATVAATATVGGAEAVEVSVRIKALLQVRIHCNTFFLFIWSYTFALLKGTSPRAEFDIEIRGQIEAD